MFHELSEYLERYRILIQKHSVDTKIVLGIINTETSAGLTEKSITIKNGVVSVSGHPIVKGLIYQKKERILQRIHKAGILSVEDIH